MVEIGDVEPLDVDAPRVAISLEEPTDIGAQVLLVGVRHRHRRTRARREPLRPAQRRVGQGRGACGARRGRTRRARDDHGRGRAGAPAAGRDARHRRVRRPRRPGRRTARRRSANSSPTSSAAPASLGIGPRFLHSTGQMHKGGPDDAVHLQVVEQPLVDLADPGSALHVRHAAPGPGRRRPRRRCARPASAPCASISKSSPVGRRRQDRDGGAADPTRPRHPSRAAGRARGGDVEHPPARRGGGRRHRRGGGHLPRPAVPLLPDEARLPRRGGAGRGRRARAGHRARPVARPASTSSASSLEAYVAYVEANRPSFVALVRGAVGSDPQLLAVFESHTGAHLPCRWRSGSGSPRIRHR